MAPFPDRKDIVYFSTKTWEHVASAAFRQHLADSHCSNIHGYGLTMKATFAANQLDERNWVVDFGGLKPFKTWLEDTFDHKLLIASDDPKLCHDWVDSEIAEVRILPATGCEAFARLCFEHLEQWLVESGYAPRVWLNSFEVMEHSGNSALIQRRFR